LEYLARYNLLGVPLWIILLGGVCGVLVDVDHPISYWIMGQTSRAGHIPFAIISLFVLCYITSRTRGLYNKYILRKGK